MAKMKWKGKMTEDLTNGYGSTLRKGDEVVCWKKRRYESNIINDKLSFQGDYEYHYSNKTVLVRTTKFLIEGQEGCPIIKEKHEKIWKPKK